MQMDGAGVQAYFSLECLALYRECFGRPCEFFRNPQGEPFSDGWFDGTFIETDISPKGLADGNVDVSCVLSKHNMFPSSACEKGKACGSSCLEGQKQSERGYVRTPTTVFRVTARYRL